MFRKRSFWIILVALLLVASGVAYVYYSRVHLPAQASVEEPTITTTSVRRGDLVITADIPLAAEIIEKKAWALNPRGEFYSEANIRERLNMRDFMDTLRASGMETGGPPPLNQTDRRNFANQLDQFLTRYVKNT